MQYKGKELVEFTSDKNVAFSPPKKMFVWDCEGYIYKRRVVAYLGGYHRDYKVIAFGPIDECKTLESYAHCAESSPALHPLRGDGRTDDYGKHGGRKWITAKR